jgi:uncharacterized protein
MNRRTLFKFILVAVALAFAGAAHAEDLGAVRARMEQRLAKLDAAKERGTLGENNRGFVEVRGSDGDASGLAAEENKDRETVYAAIAQQQKTSADLVGRARARQISQGSRAGVWVQDQSGEWKKK